MLHELLDMAEDALDKTPRGPGVFDGNIVCNRVEVLQSRLGPDYLSHLCIRVRALA